MGSAITSPRGVTRFCSGIGAPHATGPRTPRGAGTLGGEGCVPWACGLGGANILPCSRRSLSSRVPHAIGGTVLARILAGVTIVGFATGVVLAFLDAATGRPGGSELLEDLVFVVSFAAFPATATCWPAATGELDRLADARDGRSFGVGATVSSLGWYLLHTGRHDAGLALLAFDSPSWVPIVVLPVTFLLPLLLDGHLLPEVALVRMGRRRRADDRLLRDPARPGAPRVTVGSEDAEPLGISALGPILDVAQALILVTDRRPRLPHGARPVVPEVHGESSGFSCGGC